MKLVLFLSGCIFLNEAFANDMQLQNDRQETEAIIPFIIERNPRVISQGLKYKSTLGSKTEQLVAESKNRIGISQDDGYLQDFSEKVAHFAASGLKKLVKTFKEDICKSNSKGEFEITLKVDASGKVLGIGASGEGGLKALIRCD